MFTGNKARLEREDHETKGMIDKQSGQENGYERIPCGADDGADEPGYPGDR
jgi:hypothetical protein